MPIKTLEGLESEKGLNLEVQFSIYCVQWEGSLPAIILKESESLFWNAHC